MFKFFKSAKDFLFVKNYVIDHVYRDRYPQYLNKGYYSIDAIRNRIDDAVAILGHNPFDPNSHLNPGVAFLFEMDKRLNAGRFSGRFHR